MIGRTDWEPLPEVSPKTVYVTIIREKDVEAITVAPSVVHGWQCTCAEGSGKLTVQQLVRLLIDAYEENEAANREEFDRLLGTKGEVAKMLMKPGTFKVLSVQVNSENYEPTSEVSINVPSGDIVSATCEANEYEGSTGMCAVCSCAVL